jgi:hypothetical protein
MWALDILRRDFAHSALFVLKDPRICRLLPFWLEVFAAFGVTVKHVLPLSNPLEVAASLRKRDGLSVPRSLIVWLRHVLEAEAVTRGHPRSFVTYDQLLSDWRGVIAALSERLEIPWPRRSATAGIQIDAFLGQRYRHHTVQAAELEGRREVPEWVRVTYGTLLQLASEGESESLHERLDEEERKSNRPTAGTKGTLPSKKR